MKRSDYYKILGCLVGAGEIELAQAFKASLQKAHAAGGLRISNKDIGFVCVVKIGAKKETGLIVSTTNGIQVYVFDRHALVKVQSDQIINVSERRLTSSDIKDLYGSPTAWRVLPKDIMQKAKRGLLYLPERRS
jgi:hypothetical protein